MKEETKTDAAKTLAELKAEAYDLIALMEQYQNAAKQIAELLQKKNAEIQAMQSLPIEQVKDAGASEMQS